MEGVVPAQEVAQVDDAGEQLGEAGGKGRAPHAPVQDENGHIVQHAVRKAAGDDRQDGDAGITVGLDEDLHVVGDDEADGKGGEALEVVDGVLVRYAVCAQQTGEGLQKREDQRGDGQAEARQEDGVLREKAVGLLALVLTQVDGNDGAGAHGEDDADGEQHVGERHGQVHGGHGVFAHAVGDEQAVHDGVEGKDHQGRHGGGYEVEKLGGQAALIEHFG